MELKRGLYETDYGNTAYVSGPKAKTARDLDSGDKIPVSMLFRFIRAVQKDECF